MGSPNTLTPRARARARYCVRPVSNDSNDNERHSDNNNMLRSARPRLPGDVFNINDHVKCTNPRSKHYGHTGIVIGMGRTRLNVTFDNGHVGKFLDWRDAALITPPKDRSSSFDLLPASSNAHTNDVVQLTELLEHMAFTVATIVSSKGDEPPHMEQLMGSFDRSVRAHATSMTALRRQSRSANPPTPEHIIPDDG
jgi:hypothetical protein